VSRIRSSDQLASIPGAEFVVLPEASHSINWEQPEAFNR
jgi:pimeloyl-ACP methyl ester carboxylesterase